MCPKTTVHCTMMAKTLIKTLRDGCLAGVDGIDLSTAEGVNGETEVTG